MSTTLRLGATVTAMVSDECVYDFLHAMEYHSEHHIVEEEIEPYTKEHRYKVRTLTIPSLYDGCECDAVMMRQPHGHSLKLVVRDRSEVRPNHWSLRDLIRKAMGTNDATGV